ncbi:MAG: putative nucleotidyltransferase substrate binding domain-containing protein [Hydrogenobacter sp.]
MLDPERFFKETYPFDRLSEEDIKRLSSNIMVRYYSKGETIFEEGSPSLEFLYVIRKGAVVLKKGNVVVDYLHEGDSFDYLSILEDAPPFSKAVAIEDTILFMIHKRMFLRLLKDYEELRNFYTKKLIDRVQKEKPQVSIGFDRWINMPIRHLRFSPPLFVDGQEPLSQVILKMVEEDVSFSLVCDEGVIGIITERDIIKKALAKGLDPKNLKAKDVASFPLICVSIDAFLSDALLLMTKHNIRRLGVKEKDTIVGVLEDKDIISYQTQNVLFIVKDISKAKNIEEIAYMYSLTLNAVVQQVKQGIDPELIGKYISEVNDRIMQRVFFLTIKEMGMEPPSAFSVLVLGSEGRREQSLKTDQDNAMIYEDMPMLDLSVDEYFRDFSERYIKNLLRVGFPPCPGHIMLSNPLWRKNLKDWFKQIDEWVENPTQENALRMSVFLDLRSVFGSEWLAKTVRDYIFRKASENKVFLSFLASQALRFKVPLGFFRDFVVEKTGSHKGEFDIKAGGIFPLLHGVRVLALEHKVSSTNTFERLKDLSSAGVISESFSKDLADAYRFLLAIRLKFQADALLENREPTNYINPRALSRAERTVLKDVFRIVEEFQSFLSSKYKLSYFV